MAQGVGYKNHKYFYLLLFYSSIGATVTLFAATRMLRKRVNTGGLDTDDATGRLSTRAAWHRSVLSLKDLRLVMLPGWNS